MRAASDCSVAVVIPAYRVERHIAAVIRGLPAWVTWVVVVDDCSPDGVAAEVERVRDPRVCLVRHEHNQGVGGAMRTGYARCLELGADLIVKMDGDDQMDPAFLPVLLEPLRRGQADYAKGNRWHNARQLTQMPLVRRLGNLGLSFLTKLASGYWRLFDPCNGYTAVSAPALRRVPLEDLASDYYFEISLLVQLNLVQAVVCDVPIPARYGDEVSSLRVGRILRRFPLALGRSFLNRLWRRYFVYNFGPVGLFLMGGIALAGWGVACGGFFWARSIATGTPATAGSVMLSAMPLLMGFQMLLQAAVLDMAGEPTQPLCQAEPVTPLEPLAAPVSRRAA